MWAGTNWAGTNIVVLDLEILQHPQALSTGWGDKKALGLSIGAYLDLQDGRVHWFDQPSLQTTISQLLLQQPLIISFNGRIFDAAVMAACAGLSGESLVAWQALWDNSYDILHEIWAVTGRDFAKGNSLDALCTHNVLGKKLDGMTGAQAPTLWQQGHIATVCNYCQNDVYLTLALAQCIARGHGRLERPAGEVYIRHVAVEEGAQVSVYPPGRVRTTHRRPEDTHVYIADASGPKERRP